MEKVRVKVKLKLPRKIEKLKSKGMLQTVNLHMVHGRKTAPIDKSIVGIEWKPFFWTSSTRGSKQVHASAPF